MQLNQATIVVTIVLQSLDQDWLQWKGDFFEDFFQVPCGPSQRHYPTEDAKIQIPFIQLLFVKMELIAGGFSEPYSIVNVVARKFAHI